MSPRPLSVLLLGALAVLILGYGLFEARKIIEGPVVTIASPANGSATSTTGVIVAGVAQNISFLTINDRPSFTDQAGNYTEMLSLPQGPSIITVAAIDRFGRRTSKSVTINVLAYCPIS
jgi:hypothetical protein